jgi:hypothetical protein
MPRNSQKETVLRALKEQGHKIDGRPARYVKVLKRDGTLMMVGPTGELFEGRAANNLPYLQAPPIDLGTKQGKVIKLITRREGATLAELVKATKWKEDSIRGSLASEIPQKIGPGVKVVSVKGPDGQRIYYADLPSAVRGNLRFSGVAGNSD